MTKILCKHPDPEKAGTNISKAKYDSMKAALLKAIPRSSTGVPFKELRELVRPHLDSEVYAGASISWYVTTVKLDLEARGLIERVAGAVPQHLRRVGSRR